jgi:phenylalanyl-tRNA synthetase beta chain
VPSHRATGDVAIEADIIEEIARRIGYNAITPALPRATVRRFPLNPDHELENRTVAHFTTAHGFHEIHAYIWYDAAWLKKLGVNPGPCVELANPPGDGLHQLRRTLVPGLLAAVEKNRFHFPSFSLLEVGSVFEVAPPNDREYRHAGLVLAQRGKALENELYARLKGAIEEWAWQLCAAPVAFARVPAAPDRPWEHPHRTAEICLGSTNAGRLSVIDLSLRRAMDEHLAAWSIVWAELWLSALHALPPTTEPLDRIPAFPQVDLDFSILVERSTPYETVASHLRGITHPLLKRLRFVTAYEGESIAANQRSLTFRATLGHPERTLMDADLNDFRNAFQAHVTQFGYDIRR